MYKPRFGDAVVTRKVFETLLPFAMNSNLDSCTLPALSAPARKRSVKAPAAAVMVPVTVELFVIKPLNKYNSLVVVAPLFEIVCSVAVVAAEPGQFTPFARQTLNPFTSTAPAFNKVPEAVLKPSHDVEVPFVKVRFVMVPFVPNKLVVVTAVPVPLVNVRPAKDVLPSTVKVLVTVELAPINPPKK